MSNNRILLGILVLFTSPIYAAEISIGDAWARATAPGQENGSVALVITSQKDARLIAVTSPASTSAEIHTMSIDNGVMKMRQLEFLPLPAKQAVNLGPGGDHLMLFGLKKPLKVGDQVELTLTVRYPDKRTEKIKMQAKVRPITAGRDRQHQH